MSDVAAGGGLDGVKSARRWPAAGPIRVPSWIFTDEALYVAERERIFRGATWNYIALSCEVAKGGDFKRNFIGDIPIVVTRDGEGNVNGFVNACAHRGAMFCQKPLGNQQEFMCPYHQWTYDLKGNLAGLPFRRGFQKKGGMPDDFKLEDHGLEKLRVVERGGAIWASFDAGVEPFEDYLGAKMLHYYDRVFDGRPLKVLGYMRQEIPANWKLYVDNQKDPYHATLLHYFLISFGLFRATEPSWVRMDGTGRHACLMSQRGGQVESTGDEEIRHNKVDMKLHGEELIQPEREWASKGPETAVIQSIWPAVIIQQQSNTLAVRHIIPRGVGAYELDWTFFGYRDEPAALTEKRLLQANLMGPAGYVSLDDSEVIAFLQDGIDSNDELAGVVEMDGKEPNEADTLVTEGALRAFYNYYREVMAL